MSPTPQNNSVVETASTNLKSPSMESQPAFPSWHSTVAGGMAGFGSRMVTAPLDLVRIRRQLAVGVVYPSESMWQTWIQIVRQEGGVTALYKGNLAAIFLWVGYAAAQFSVYDTVKDALPKEYWNKSATAFVSGAIAGLCATVVSYPFDVCRTTFAAQGVTYDTAASEPKTVLQTRVRRTPPLCEPVMQQSHHPAAPPSIHLSSQNERIRSGPLPFSSLYEPSPHQHTLAMRSPQTQPTPQSTSLQPSTASPGSLSPPRTYTDFAVRLYQQKGLRGFYAGASPALIQIVPYMGLNFCIYDFLSDHSTVIGSAYAGSISGAVSKVIVYPLDTVKRRLQAQALLTDVTARSRGLDLYTGMWDCVRRVYRQEGGWAFYRGITPSVLKTAIASSLSFAIYRWTINLLQAAHNSNQ